jgi:hypothetical protein
MSKYYPSRPPKQVKRVSKGMKHCIIAVCECGHYSCYHHLGFLAVFFTRTGLTHCNDCMCPKFKRDHDYEFDIKDWEYKEVKE